MRFFIFLLTLTTVSLVQADDWISTPEEQIHEILMDTTCPIGACAKTYTTGEIVKDQQRSFESFHRYFKSYRANYFRALEKKDKYLECFALSELNTFLVANINFEKEFNDYYETNYLYQKLLNELSERKLNSFSKCTS